MRKATVTEAKARLNAYLREAEEGPVILTRNGKPVAVLFSIEEQDDWDDHLLESPQFQAVLEKARQEIAEGKGIEHDEFWRSMKGERKRLLSNEVKHG